MKKFVAGILLFGLLNLAEAGILLDAELLVPRDGFKEVHYLAGESGTFRAEFHAAGGFNDDVTVYAFDQTNYARWLHHYKEVKFLAKFNKKKHGRFEVPAKAGETYYFVFDNYFSSVSHKKVKTKIEFVGN